MKYIAFGENFMINIDLWLHLVLYFPLDSHNVLYVSYTLAVVSEVILN